MSVTQEIRLCSLADRMTAKSVERGEPYVLSDEGRHAPGLSSSSH